MVEKVKKRRLLEPCPAYDVERIESWLQDMAKEGWMLEGESAYWLGFFTFVKSEPQTVRYRLEPKTKRHSDFTNAPDEEAEELYKEYGWEFVTQFNFFYIYRTNDPNARELNTDLAVQAAALKQVKRNSTTSTVWSAYLVASWFFKLRHEGTRILVTFDWPIALAFIFMIVGALVIQGKQFLHMHRLRKQLKENIPLDHNKPWQKNARNQRIKKISWILLDAFVFIALCTSCTHAMSESYNNSPTAEFPGDPPFVTCADLGEFTQKRSISGYNDYNLYSTSLAPTIIEWKEFGEIRTADGKVIDGSLSIDYYETVSPVLARGLVDDFLYQYKKYKDFQVIDAPDIDADYVVAFSYIYPTVLIQKDNIFICATVGLEYREEYLLEEWAYRMAEYLQK